MWAGYSVGLLKNTQFSSPRFCFFFPLQSINRRKLKPHPIILVFSFCVGITDRDDQQVPGIFSRPMYLFICNNNLRMSAIYKRTIGLSPHWRGVSVLIVPHGSPESATPSAHSNAISNGKTVASSFSSM